MKRNSNFITSQKLDVTKTFYSGIHDTFDNYNFRKDDSWPEPRKITSVNNATDSYSSAGNYTSSSNYGFQGRTFRWQVYFTGFIPGDYIWLVTNDAQNSFTASDFTDNSLTSKIQLSSTDITNGYVYFYKTLSSTTVDGVQEGFRVYWYYGDVSTYFGDFLWYSGIFYIRTPSATFDTSTYSLNEGSTVTPTIYTNYVADNLVLYWRVLYGSGLTAEDFTTQPSLTQLQLGSSGSYGFNQSWYTLDVSPGYYTPNQTWTANSDFLTEGTETITMYLRWLTSSGPILHTATINVNDTSQNVLATISESTTSIDEGSNVVFTIDTSSSATTVPDGTVLNWDLENISTTTGYWNNTDIIEGFANTVSIVSNTATVTITANTDAFTEGSESFRLRLKDTYGTYIANSNTVTINDTSTGTAETLQVVAGQAEYTTPGSYSWTAPNGVTNVSVVCIGAGAAGVNSAGGARGGGGGGLGWKNNIPVVPGNSYTVEVGAGTSSTGTATTAGSSYFISLATVAGYGGTSTSGAAATYVGDGGGNGGIGGVGASGYESGGGGAGGYSGAGGNGGWYPSPAATDGSGGGGGGGGYGNLTGGGGGGTGIYGEGTNGSAGASTTGSYGTGGGGGSGGVDGNTGASPVYGGNYGGGSYGRFGNGGTSVGAGGAVRIIWGDGLISRSFPSTNTGDV